MSNFYKNGILTLLLVTLMLSGCGGSSGGGGDDDSSSLSSSTASTLSSSSSNSALSTSSRTSSSSSSSTMSSVSSTSSIVSSSRSSALSTTSSSSSTPTISITSSDSATVVRGALIAINVDATVSNGTTIIYSLDGADASEFTVDADGVVSFRRVVDAGTYRFRVKAAAGSVSTTQNIAITVTTPVNHAPQITSSSTASVNENQRSAIDVDATDSDGDTLTYSFAGLCSLRERSATPRVRLDDCSYFTIERSTGIVRFRVAPNYERKSSYNFIVAVSDGTSIITQNITITILDVAESSAPIITAPSSFIRVNENQKSAFTVIATDTDEDTIVYSLEGGADTDSFEINSSTGVVEFKVEPDYEQQATYFIKVGASDASHTTTKNIRVSINNLEGDSKVITTGQTRAYYNHDDGWYRSGIQRLFIANTGIYTESKTGLKIAKIAYGLRNYENAQATCSALVKGGISTWRLPSIDELNLLIDRSSVAHALSDPIQSSFFKEKTWSLTRYARGGAVDKYYVLDLKTGVESVSSDTKMRRVICIQRAMPLFETFTRSSNHIVNHSKTNLQWWDPATYHTVLGFPMLVGDEAKSGSFTQAIDNCEVLNVSGKGDWRLPNINELLSIVRRNKLSGSAFYGTFKSNTSGIYFSSTTAAISSDLVWGVDFRTGKSLLTFKLNAYYRCVRTTGD